MTALDRESSELLFRLNLAAGSLHGILGFVLITWRLSNPEADTHAPIFTQDLQMGEDENLWYSVGLRRTDAEVDLWVLTFLFTLVTTVAHFLYATRLRPVYEASVDRGAQFLRWIEYGLSATPMYVIISMLAGVRTASTLAIVCAASIGTMIQGFVVEVATANKDKALAGASLLTGWVLFHGNWILIVSEWYLGLQDSRDTIRNDITRDLTDPPEGPPDNLEALIFVMLTLFAAFGATACYRFASCFYPDAGLGLGDCDYVRIEVAYVSLSFASKFILAIWLISTVFVEIPWLNQICGCAGDCVPGTLPTPT